MLQPSWAVTQPRIVAFIRSASYYQSLAAPAGRNSRWSNLGAVAATASGRERVALRKRRLIGTFIAWHRLWRWSDLSPGGQRIRLGGSEVDVMS